jgi:quinol-cytochrome oxidoreductase complex cytochrome b subunit
MGITAGRTAAVETAVADVESHLVRSVPGLMVRLLLVGLLTFAVTSALAVWVGAPLEAPADPQVTPNPAKAPWYFLWLQELVTTTTVRFGGFTVNGALVGGVIVPGLLLLWAVAAPWLDRSGPAAAGVWFHRDRRRANAIFLIVCLALIVLTVIGTFLRGPFWDFYWPWEPWPEEPPRF